MGYANELGMLVDFVPDKAREKILAAFVAAKANRAACAKALKVDRATLWRWVKKLDIEGEVAKVEKRAKREGWKLDERRVGGDGPKKRTKKVAPKKTPVKKRSKAA